MTQCLVSQDELQVLLRRDPVGEDDDLTVTEGVAGSVGAIEVTLWAGSHGLCVQLREPCLEVSLVADNRQLRRTCQLAHEVASDQLHPTGCDLGDGLAVQIDDVVDGVPVGEGEDPRPQLDHVYVAVGLDEAGEQGAIITECSLGIGSLDTLGEAFELISPLFSHCPRCIQERGDHVRQADSVCVCACRIS